MLVTLLFSFILFTALASLFVLFMGGSISSLIGNLFKEQSFNGPLRLALGYFLGLGVFTAILSLLLVFLPTYVRQVFWAVGILWGIFSVWGVKQVIGQRGKNILKERTVWGISLLCLFLFFLQVYSTSMLDEWLHRPVVDHFVATLEFPLINPLDRNSSFHTTYHYGGNLLSGFIGYFSGQSGSTSMDIYKMANVLASIFLIAGFGRQFFSASRNFAWVVSAAVLFLGSSFFLADIFTFTHLKNFVGWSVPNGERWPLNVPLSFNLMGITWVGICILWALTLFLDELVRASKRYEWKMLFLQTVFLSLFFIGFFLITELYAVFGLLGFAMAVVLLVCQKKISLVKTGTAGGVFTLLLVLGMFFSGGIVGGIVKKGIISLPSLMDSGTAGETSQIKESSGIVVQEAYKADLFQVKGIQSWGYASEKRDLPVASHSLYYLRTFAFEAILLTACFFLYRRLPGVRRVNFFPVTFCVATLGFVMPFFLTTSWGNLNFFKITLFSLLVLHAYALFFLLQNRQYLHKSVKILLVVMLAGGVWTGTLLGINVQTQWISSKGKSQYCSQNPLCDE